MGNIGVMRVRSKGKMGLRLLNNFFEWESEWKFETFYWTLLFTYY
ncbi:hypothetical protein [Clostridium faecium]|nr:hypothetical protein [Clostridium faecium]